MCVTWKKTCPLCSRTNGSKCRIITNTFSGFLIEELDEGSSYRINVMVTNAAGNNISDPVMAVTLETGIQ